MSYIKPREFPLYGEADFSLPPLKTNPCSAIELTTTSTCLEYYCSFFIHPAGVNPKLRSLLYCCNEVTALQTCASFLSSDIHFYNLFSLLKPSEKIRETNIKRN